MIVCPVCLTIPEGESYWCSCGCNRLKVWRDMMRFRVEGEFGKNRVDAVRTETRLTIRTTDRNGVTQDSAVPPQEMGLATDWCVDMAIADSVLGS